MMVLVKKQNKTKQKQKQKQNYILSNRSYETIIINIFATKLYHFKPLQYFIEQFNMMTFHFILRSDYEKHMSRLTFWDCILSILFGDQTSIPFP